MVSLLTEHLTLRELTEADAAFILALLNTPGFLRHVGDRGVRTLADASAYIRTGPMASYQRMGFGLWLVALMASQAPIGICGLIKREQLEDVDIGFAFLPQFEARGYAFEAASATLRYGRDSLALKRVVAIVSPDNERSARLLGRLGFHFERLIAWPPPDGDTLKLFALSPFLPDS